MWVKWHLRALKANCGPNTANSGENTSNKAQKPIKNSA